VLEEPTTQHGRRGLVLPERHAAELREQQQRGDGRNGRGQPPMLCSVPGGLDQMTFFSRSALI
jgi:hypothetical protein